MARITNLLTSRITSRTLVIIMITVSLFILSSCSQQNSQQSDQQNGQQSDQQNGQQSDQQNGQQSDQQNSQQNDQQNGQQSDQQNGQQNGQQKNNQQNGQQNGMQSGQQNGMQSGQQNGMQSGQQNGQQSDQQNGMQSGQQSTQPRVRINVAAIKGPTAMGMVKMMNEADNMVTGAGMTNEADNMVTETGMTNEADNMVTGAGMTNEADNMVTGARNEYSFGIYASIDEIIPKLVQGTVDIAAVPPNIASILYNNTNGSIRVIAIHTLGVLYLVENGSNVNTVEDLRGKTIYTSGKGGPPEYAINYVLRGNGLDPDRDVTIEFKSEHTECVTILSQHVNAVAMLPQPFLAAAQMKDESIRIAIDLNAEWESLQKGDNPSAMITGVAIARTEFIENHPEALEEFMIEYEKSISWVNSNTDDASTLIDKYDIVPEAVAKRALPYCGIVFMRGVDIVEKLRGYLEVLYEQNPAAVGGSVPDGDFFYIE